MIYHFRKNVNFSVGVEMINIFFKLLCAERKVRLFVFKGKAFFTAVYRVGNFLMRAAL